MVWYGHVRWMDGWKCGEKEECQSGAALNNTLIHIKIDILCIFRCKPVSMPVPTHLKGPMAKWITRRATGVHGRKYNCIC